MLTILNGLGPGYCDIVTFITGSKIEFDDAYALLLTHETRLEQEHDDKCVFNANYAYIKTYYPKAFYAHPRVLSVRKCIFIKEKIVILYFKSH